MPVLIPRPAPHTAREFVYQLVTIIAGILIALSIDGLLELNRQRAIVREAHAAIAFEIAENLRDLEETLPALDAHERGLKDGLRFGDDLLSKGKTDVKFQAPLSTPSLNRASWQTADRTGALGYMDYADVKEYSELYELQDLIVDSQNQLIARLPGLSTLVFHSRERRPDAIAAAGSRGRPRAGDRFDRSGGDPQEFGPPTRRGL